MVDIIGMDGISHHTVLEVFENGKWENYDTRYRDANGKLGDCVNYQIKGFRNRPWSTNQKLYHTFIEHNTVIKFIAMKFLGVK